MRSDRACAAVMWWVRLYTAGLPRPVADRRLEEIRADLHDHVDHQRSLGISERKIATHITSRMIRGAAADATWRARTSRAARSQMTMERAVKTATFTRSAVRVSALVFAVLAVPLIGTAISDDVEWSVTDFVLAGTMVGAIGACAETAIHRRGNVVVAVIVALTGVAAGVVGELDDAPGLILLGLLMIAGAGAMTHRRARKSA